MRLLGEYKFHSISQQLTRRAWGVTNRLRLVSVRGEDKKLEEFFIT